MVVLKCVVAEIEAEDWLVFDFEYGLDEVCLAGDVLIFCVDFRVINVD